MPEDAHYEKTRELFRWAAQNLDGYYDARPGSLLQHTRWQLRIRKIALHLLHSTLAGHPHPACGIEIGCGRGDFTLEVARAFPELKEMHGCDFTKEALEIARREAASRPGVQFFEANLLALPFGDRQYDFTLCINVLHHVVPGDLSRALAELARITRRHLILEIKNEKNFYYRHVHRKRIRGVCVYPTSVQRVSKALDLHGFVLRRSLGIFHFERLSPLVVLGYERDASSGSVTVGGTAS
ncbi:MAG: class I SAM-dependent methyltransferase [Planctomycetes bacterium]|nr:class I SAM-dependent methyltransferase [Planctomycetota bacterium]